MRLVCCSPWPPQLCFTTHTRFPQFFLLKLQYATSNSGYFNMFIPIHCLHMAMNVDGRISSTAKNSIMARCSKCKSPQPSSLTDTEPELWIAVGSRLHMVVGRYHVTVVTVLSTLHYSHTTYDRGGKTFQPILIFFLYAVYGTK